MYLSVKLAVIFLSISSTSKYKGKHRAVGVFLARSPQILVLDPALANEVLVKNFTDFRDTVTSSYVSDSEDYNKYVARNPFFTAGDAWKKRRTDGGAGLTANRLKLAYAIWEEVGNKLVDYLGRALKARSDNIIETRDVSKHRGNSICDYYNSSILLMQLCYRYTAQAMGDFIWGIDVRSLSGAVDEVSKFQEFSSAWAYHAFHSMRRFNRTPIAPVMRRLFRMRFFKKEADQFYLKLTQDAADLRRSGNGANRSDYLAHLLQLQAKGASTDDLVGHALTVLMDGFETSAAVLYHLLYTVRFSNISKLFLVNFTIQFNFSNL